MQNPTKVGLFFLQKRLDKSDKVCYNNRVGGVIPALFSACGYPVDNPALPGCLPVDRLVDNLWITRCVTNDFTFSLRFSTLAQAPLHHLVTFPLWRRGAL